MTFDYDQEADALDITLGEGIVARTKEVEPGTLVDVDEHGNVIAIELIRPRRKWPLEEILAEFEIDDDDAAILRSLWHADKPYPFAEPAPLAAAG